MRNLLLMLCFLSIATPIFAKTPLEQAVEGAQTADQLIEAAKLLPNQNEQARESGRDQILSRLAGLYRAASPEVKEKIILAAQGMLESPYEFRAYVQDKLKDAPISQKIRFIDVVTSKAGQTTDPETKKAIQRVAIRSELGLPTDAIQATIVEKLPPKDPARVLMYGVSRAGIIEPRSYEIKLPTPPPLTFVKLCAIPLEKLWSLAGGGK